MLAARADGRPRRELLRRPVQRLAATLAEGGLCQAPHACECHVQECELLAPAEEPEAEADERTPIARPLRVRVDAELHVARVEPLPHLPVHLAHLEVSLERLIGPAPHARDPAVLAALFVIHARNSHTPA